MAKKLKTRVSTGRGRKAQNRFKTEVSGAVEKDEVYLLVGGDDYDAGKTASAMAAARTTGKRLGMSGKFSLIKTDKDGQNWSGEGDSPAFVIQKRDAKDES